MCNVLGLFCENWIESCHLLPLFANRNRTSERISDSKTEARLPVSDPGWQLLSYDEFKGKNGKTTSKRRDKDEDSAQPDDGPFKVYYRRRVQILWPDVVEVLVTSSSLIGILREYLPDHGSLKSLAEPKIDGRDLYVVLQSLKFHASEARAKFSRGNDLTRNDFHIAPNGSQPATREHHPAIVREDGTNESATDQEAALGILHLEHLLRFLEEEYKDVLKTELRMREEKQLTWDMLWTFLSKGAKVGYYCDISGRLLCAMVAGTHYAYNSRSLEWSFDVTLDVWDFDGTTYKPCKTYRKIVEFHQECHFSDLAVCPIEILGNPLQLNDMFVANGRTFHELVVKSPNRFMRYEGTMYQKRRCGYDWQLYKEKGNGRVMIDQCSFSSINPDYPMENARPPTKWSRGSRVFKNIPPAPINRDRGSSSVRKHESVSDGNLVFAPAIVYGFSFKLKWGCFSVSQFSDVVFDTEAFEELTMDPEMKLLVHNLVRHYICSGSDPEKLIHRVDPIAEKGEGCILLCHGPPGTGKTLTAESIAEKNRQPLWAMGLGEMGSTLDEVEATLLKVFDIATRWKAVLLLDEADIFVEKRDSGASLVRNAMTGVFLRQLEYYRGVLFLTTNRIDTFDDAFRSRISLIIHYGELGLADKAKVWKISLGRAKVDGVSEEFCREMAGENLNGREIRKVVQTAQVWAKSIEEPCATKHVKYVVGMYAKSLTTLNQVLDTYKK